MRVQWSWKWVVLQAFCHISAFFCLTYLLHNDHIQYNDDYLQLTTITSQQQQTNYSSIRPLRISLYTTSDCKGNEVFHVSDGYGERFCEECLDFCGKRFPETKKTLHTRVQSIKIDTSELNEAVELFSDCKGTYNYGDRSKPLGSIRKTDGCVDITDMSVSNLRFIDRLRWKGLAKDKVSPETTKKLKVNSEVGKYVVTYSVESTPYFRWQVWTHYHAFIKSNQNQATYMRLLSASDPDDIAQHVPTFTASHHLNARAYSPLNKPNSLDKWLHSPFEAPKEEVIVVVDPDNWILKDLSPWVEQVKPGFAVAQSAWFYGSSEVDQIWQLVCEENCEVATTDHVAVPIFIHREDLKRIAPLWSHYTLKVRSLMKNDVSFNRKYKHTQITGWSVEMIGYVYAAAHVGVKHNIEKLLQIRDVDARQPDDVMETIPMIHMGRAWFPPEYEPGKQWWHTEGEAFKRFGAQVWCKCNSTAGEILPWPLPDGIDIVSRHTLTLLHEANQLYKELWKSPDQE